MDPKKETPEQALIKETDGIPGVDHSDHPAQMRTEIAKNVGIQPDELIPADEKAEIGTETANFLEEVVHVQGPPTRAEVDNQSSNLPAVGKIIEAISPTGETVGTTPSGEFFKIAEEKKAA